MKKAIIVLILLFSVPAFAEIGEIGKNTPTSVSRDISMTEGWVVTYEKRWIEDPAKFHIGNISDKVAFEISALIYCYDSHGKELDIIRKKEKGPLRPGYEYTFTTHLPNDTSTMKAEVYWKDKYD